MPRTRVLVVDDEREIRHMFERMLAHLREGVVVDTAASGEEALELLDTHEYDIVLSDQRMTGMKGTELLARVQSVQPQAIRVIVTAYRAPDIPMDAINEAHVHAYVEKPWRTQDVLRKLDELLLARDAHVEKERALAAAFARGRPSSRVGGSAPSP